MTTDAANGTPTALYVVPSLRASVGERGGVVLTQKFLEGIQEYVRDWPGPVVVCMQPSEELSTNLDHVELDPVRLPFEFRWMPTDREQQAKIIAPARLVLCSLVRRLRSIVEIATRSNIPVVMVGEYTYDTRRRIINAETRNVVRRLRRHVYNVRTERIYRELATLSTGIQCNGTPAFGAYGVLNPRPLLYFDTRVRGDMLADESLVQRRVDRMRSGGPLQLVFTGRLVTMKGADHLPIIADELRRRDVAFELTICGGGPLEPAIREETERLGLNGELKIRGVLDFERELLPFVAEHGDLFVCCHRQGDPSCTYLETMACGVPIVGYDNEALRGIAAKSGVGWIAPLDDPRALAARIAELAADRDLLAVGALAARAFASGHTFERTMAARVEHMVACAEAFEDSRS